MFNIIRELGAFAVFTAGALMDYKESKVYRALWWPGNLLGILPVFDALSKKSRYGFGAAAGIMVFIIIQNVLFKRTYGPADVRCFNFVSVMMGGWIAQTFEEGSTNILYFADGMTEVLKNCFVIMTMAYLLLIFHQLIRKNIKSFRLKKKVPFIPYIYTACLIHIIYVSGNVRFLLVSWHFNGK